MTHLEPLVLPDEVVVLIEERAELLDLLLPLVQLLQKFAVALCQPQHPLVEIFYGVLHLSGVLWKLHRNLGHVPDRPETLETEKSVGLTVTEQQIAPHQSHKATELPVHRTTEPSPNGNSLNKHCSICNLDHKFHA